MRDGLAMLLGLLDDVEVAGTAANGEETLALAAQLQPDVVLMDLRMPRCDGVEATRLLRERAPRIAGTGQAVIDPAVQLHLVEAIADSAAPETGREPGPPQLPDSLTPREAEVLALIADGLSNAEIAARLVVTEATVKSHINHLLAKTGCRDRAQAVSYAYRQGLARPAG